MFDYRMQRALAIMLLVLLVGTIAFKYIESWSWVDSVYFTIITMTTIGYGDIHPTHDISKIFASIFGLFSVVVLFYMIGIAVENRFHQKIKEHITLNKNQDKE